MNDLNIKICILLKCNVDKITLMIVTYKGTCDEVKFHFVLDWQSWISGNGF